MAVWKWLGSAAWLRFVALGGLLFWLQHAYGDAQPDHIVLTGGQLQQLEQGFVADRGRTPSAAERQALVEQWAREEALVRHARSLGLDEGDQVVRRRLIQDVELLLEAEAEAVGEAAVRARYAADRERLRQPALRTFSQVFISGADASARARLDAARQALLHGDSPRDWGDPTGHGVDLQGMSRERLAARLGPELATAAFALPIGQWSEPLRSALGLHLLRAESEQAARVIPFEQVREQLRAELESEARAQAVQAGTLALRGQYVLERRP